MAFRDVVTLISQEEGQDKDGYPAPVETAAEVYADVRSVKRSEFYAGRQLGLVLSMAFVVRSWDYGGETAVEYDGKRYQVERAYSKDGEFTELNCSEVKGDH